jgi:hypothetical protein
LGVVGLVAVGGLWWLLAAAGSEEEPKVFGGVRGVEAVSPPTLVPPPEGFDHDFFADDGDSLFHDDINWLAARGILKGCDPPQNTSVCPGSPVSRAETAAMLVRALELTDGQGVDFLDDDTSVFEADIERIAAAGLSRGCGVVPLRRFCPDEPITRAELAAMLSRAMGYESRGVIDFEDDDGSPYEADIERIAAAGITTGCGTVPNTLFCPDEDITREQAAAFLRRALD